MSGEDMARWASIMFLFSSFLPAVAQAQAACMTTEGEGGTIESGYGTGYNQYGDGHLTIQMDPNSESIAANALTGDWAAQGLNSAVEDWNTGCSETYIPELQVQPDAERESFVNIGVNYHANEVTPPSGSSSFTLASFNTSTGTLTLYGQCPNGQGPLFSAICQQRGGNYYINWSHEWAVAFLDHELGHALGIGHDRNDGECSGFAGFMGKPVMYQSATVKPEYCALANFQNCDRSNGANCPRHPLLSFDPTGHLRERCNLIPEICRKGEPNPWWYSVFETRPVCGFELVPGPEETLQVRRICVFPAAILTPGALSYRSFEETDGPSTTVTTPSPSSVIRGVVQISGSMREDLVGVSGTLGFWLDQEVVHPTGVQYGEADPLACTGSSDPHCPYVGFSASLDTTVLPDGPHTLEVMGAEAGTDWPSPAYGRTAFTVDNTKPSVTITSPPASATLAETTQVTASAADVYGLSSLSFYVDGVYQGSDNTAPYSFSLDTTGWADGYHTLRVRAWDKAGNNRDSSVTVTFTNDLQTPQVNLTKPTAGALIRGSVIVEALATDDQGVSRVDFFLDGALLATDSTAPYRVTWTTTASVDGPHTLTAKAFDGAGKVGVSPAVGVTVDNTLPTRYVDWPSHNQSVSGSAVLISGWAIDASRVVLKTFKVDGQSLALLGSVQTLYRSDVCPAHPEVPDPNCPYVGWRAYFDSTSFSNGGHTLTATFVDAAGNPGTFNRSFIISNPKTATFYPVADATAWQTAPNNNTGAQNVLAVRSPNDGQGAYSFLKFQVTGVVGQVTSARLKVRTSTSMADLWLYWLVHSNWTEWNLTWNYFPSPGGDLGHFYNLVGQSWYSFEVSSYVTGDGTYSLGFANSNPTYSYLWSRESTDKPVLEITYVP